MMPTKRRIVFFILLLLSTAGAAQTTRIKGRVTDEETGEGIPFVGVFFEGTTIGVSTDLDGYYILETRNLDATRLTAYLIGYHAQTLRINPGHFSEINFRLRMDSSQLNASLVKPDDRYMKRILAQIDAHRSRNDPEKRLHYQCDIYTKMELDITNPEKQRIVEALMNRFEFVYSYMDTSVVSGSPYLPVMISETKAKRFHSLRPPLDKELIEASRISGINPDNSIQQFTGSMHLKTNFYSHFINSFNVEIPSPISPSGSLYYNYYLIDSIEIDARKTYQIRYHPKRLISTPSFDGEMYIDAEDFGLRKIHAKLQKGANVNWIRDLVLDQENQRVGDSVWFYKEDRMYADFSISVRDSSKLLSFLGRRQLNFSSPEFTPPPEYAFRKDRDQVMVERDAGHKGEDYWSSVRPFELTDREQGIYAMVEEVQDTPLYKSVYSIINTLMVGYFETKYVGIGPYSQIISFNHTEGTRFRAGLRTTKSFSRTWRLSGFALYGTKSHKMKGGGTVEYMFSTEPWRKLTVNAQHDMVQLGKGSGVFLNEGQNIFTSLFGNTGELKISPITELSAKYVHERRAGLIHTLSFDSKWIYSSADVPLQQPAGSAVHYITSNQLHLNTRLTREEHVTRGVFELGHEYTDWPIVNLDLVGGLTSLSRCRPTLYARAELSVNYRLRMPPAGVGYFYLNTGKIFGAVPYPLLKIHEGNNTWFYDNTAFSCMDYYEFASDTWVTFFYEHNFGGFFLGKVPGLKKLQLREVFTFKAAYGFLTDRNNGILSSSSRETRACLLFPAGMSDLRTPYAEMGAGLSNIFRILRLDAFWRLTHRHDPAGKSAIESGNLVIKGTLELKF